LAAVSYPSHPTLLMLPITYEVRRRVPFCQTSPHTKCNVWACFGESLWPWLPINVLRRQVANLHSFAVRRPVW